MKIHHLKLTFCINSEPLFQVKILKISRMKKFSTKPKFWAVGNIIKIRVLKGFVLKRFHLLANICTVFFFHSINFHHRSAPDRAESWPRSRNFQNSSNFERRYLRAQEELEARTRCVRKPRTRFKRRKNPIEKIFSQKKVTAR